MHLPDGFINGTTSAAAGVVAAGGVGVALQTGRYLSDRQVPLAGLVARPPNGLSSGQKRRVAAGVLAMQPEILVLDEPTSNLDPASRRELTNLLTGLDITQLIVTHDLPYAAEVCQRSVVIDAGRIVADGPTMAILGDETLMRDHRLELPFGFSVPPR